MVSNAVISILKVQYVGFSGHLVVWICKVIL